MSMSPFHAMYTARRLAEYGRGAARLIPAYASSDIEVYPYQIAAAMFALRSPYLGGAVLADEGSLGKTYESLLIISELYFEGRDRIMDLYGLITFIDDTALGDAEDFYKRYFRKPENYSELTAIASRYCFRTLRTQAESYTKIPMRIPVTASYSLSVKELKLAALMEDYLQKPDKLAFPKMDSYDLTLLFSRALASSPFALAGLADRANGRVKESELLEMATLAADIRPQSTGKGREMLKALKRAFAELKKRGVNQKAIIFTGSLSTIGFLHELLVR